MPNFPIVPKRKIWYVFSSVLVGLSVLAMIFFGFRYGLDFTGGSLLEVSYSNNRPANDVVSTLLAEEGIHNATLQPSDEKGLLMRLTELSEEAHQGIVVKLQEHASRGDAGNTVTEERFESFGPSLGSELKRNALYAILLVLLAIILFLAYSFRKVSRPVASWKFGAVAVIALAHDVIITLGLFSILGHLYGTEVNGFFVTALLTLMGFSVHDTIVTLDRVRENLVTHQDLTFSDLVNLSINQTLTRSINTSLTTVIVLVAIFIFGGASVRDFTLALIFGIVIGTYSSIFVASPLLVTWNLLSKKYKKAQD